MALIKSSKLFCGDLNFFYDSEPMKLLHTIWCLIFLYIIEGMKTIEKNALIGSVNIFDKAMIYTIHVYMFELHH